MLEIRVLIKVSGLLTEKLNGSSKNLHDDELNEWFITLHWKVRVSFFAIYIYIYIPTRYTM